MVRKFAIKIIAVDIIFWVDLKTLLQRFLAFYFA